MSAATSLPLPEFYTWGFSSAPIQIHLSLDAVGRIREQFLNSEKGPGALPVCGLLTGGTPKPGITRIVDFVSLQTLDAASVAEGTGRASGDVVGFYRTTSAATMSMTEEDRALAERLFRDPRYAFLLIETGKSGIGDARFCFWSEGELFDWPVMLFPFNAEELAMQDWYRRSNMVREPTQSSSAGFTLTKSPAEERVVAAPVVVAPARGPAAVSAQTETQPVAAPAPFPVSLDNQRQEAIAPKPVAKQGPLTGGRRWLAPVLTTVVAVSLLVGGFLYFTRGSKLPVAPQAAASPAEEKTRLGLAVEKRGSALVVSWNGNAPVISKANFGMLLIRGGEVSRDVPLTPEELRAGSVVYASPADQVRFQLNVVAGEQVAREFVTVVLPLVAERRVGTARSESGNSVGTLSPPPVLSASAPSPALKQFKPVESQENATAAPLSIDEPPPVAGATPVHGGTLALLPQPQGSLPSRPLTSPLPASGDLSAKGTPSGDSSLLAAEARPPVAAHQVMPAVPPLLRGRLWNATGVEVQVSVDASGSVVKAEAVPKQGLNPLLRDAAVEAARRWKFQPAQFNGHPVPADTVVRFNFAASR